MPIPARTPALLRAIPPSVNMSYKGYGTSFKAFKKSGDITSIDRCASKVLEKAGKKIHYEIVISKYLQKVPTLDIYMGDGAANVGQVGQTAGVLITNLDKGRMCCTVAVAAGSKPHLDIAEKAKKNIVINGCSKEMLFLSLLAPKH